MRHPFEKSPFVNSDVKVKICGITHPEDALLAEKLGAYALGFIFASSPRFVAPARAQNIISQLGPTIEKIGIFMNRSTQEMIDIARFCGLTGLQLHGAESPETVLELRRLAPQLKIIKAITVTEDRALLAPQNYSDAHFLLFDFKTKKSNVERPVKAESPLTIASPPQDLKNYLTCHRSFLAGGLNPANISSVIRAYPSFGVDLASGIEKSPGVKSPELMKHFFAQIGV